MDRRDCLDQYWQEQIVDRVHEEVNDFEEILIISLLVEDQLYRLQHSLEDKAVAKEFNTLSTIDLQLKEIINNYA